MIASERQHKNTDLKDKWNNPEKRHQRPHHLVIVVIQYLPNSCEAADKVQYYLEYINFIEEKRDSENQGEEL